MLEQQNMKKISKDSSLLSDKEWQKVRELLFAPTHDLRELARMAGANPRTFYRGANFRKSDLTDEALENFDLTGANLTSSKLTSSQKSYFEKRTNEAFNREFIVDNVLKHFSEPENSQKALGEKHADTALSLIHI